MAVPRTPMTRAGDDKLKDDLERLKRVERPAIIKAIAEARAHGDLSENAEYHAAKERQGFIEGPRREIGRKAREAGTVWWGPRHAREGRVGAGPGCGSGGRPARASPSARRCGSAPPTARR